MGQIWSRRGATGHVETVNGEAPLHIAVKNNNLELVKELITNDANVNHTDNKGAVPLILAIENHNIEIVKTLIANGADFYLENTYGCNALMWAIDKQQIKIVDILLANGANVNHENSIGTTALMWAIQYHRNTNIIERLITVGADLYIRHVAKLKQIFHDTINL